MRRFLNRVVFWLGVAAGTGACNGTSSDELREFAKLEAAIGMLASASAADRSVRLEQLNAIEVATPPAAELKALCISSYRTFDQAAKLLSLARDKTDAVEKEVEKLKAQKRQGQALTPEEEANVVDMSTRAATSLAQVTRELDAAERLVTSCQKKRDALRAALMAQ